MSLLWKLRVGKVRVRPSGSDVSNDFRSERGETHPLVVLLPGLVKHSIDGLQQAAISLEIEGCGLYVRQHFSADINANCVMKL